VRVLVAFDKFKGSLSAARACELGVCALRCGQPGWHLDPCPLTDGGEGFAEILTAAVRGSWTALEVSGPRGEPIEAGIGLVKLSQIPAQARAWLRLPKREADFDRPVAIIEMAAASGLGLLPPEQHDPWQTTTYGTGQLIRAAAEMGCAAILLGIGGSATNDLGLGALSALGLEFRGDGGTEIRPPIPMHCNQIIRIEGEVLGSLPPICIACDVTNPLFGTKGAAAVYGPQKGLRPEDLPRFETTMERISRMLLEHCRQSPDLSATSGTGAAGGLSFGLLAGAGARLAPGFELVSAWLGLETRIAAADLVITGEGCFDATSLSGKGPGAVAARAHALGKPVHVFAGKIGTDLPPIGWQLHAITPAGLRLEDAQREAPELLVHSMRSEFGLRSHG
jgi:glycerate kinase